MSTGLLSSSSIGGSQDIQHISGNNDNDGGMVGAAARRRGRVRGHRRLAAARRLIAVGLLGFFQMATGVEAGVAQCSCLGLMSCGPMFLLGAGILLANIPAWD